VVAVCLVWAAEAEGGSKSSEFVIDISGASYGVVREHERFASVGAFGINSIGLRAWFATFRLKFAYGRHVISRGILCARDRERHDCQSVRFNALATHTLPS